jgi:hypothetical protein
MRGTTGIFLGLSYILFCLQLNMGAEMQISFLLIKIYRYLLFFGHFCFDMVYAIVLCAGVPEAGVLPELRRFFTTRSRSCCAFFPAPAGKLE